MAYSFYMTIKGAKQGAFKGEVAQGIYKGKTGCKGFNYEVISPKDVSSGLSTGKRQHQPFSVVKEVGASTPQIFQACVSNELLTSVLFEFIQRTDEGVDTIYYTIELANASVSKQRQYAESVRSDAEANESLELEEVYFTFQKITVSNTISKTSAADDWSA